MDPLQLALIGLDYAAVAVFAAAGALAAARRKHDIVTFGFFAAVTGVGGGTLRDLLLDVPVFWVARPTYLGVALAVAALVWAVGTGRWRERILTWLDALGLAAYAVVGAAKANALGAPPLSALVMGVLTATFGGVLRDVLANEPSVLLRREIYVTAAMAGAGLFVLMEGLGAGPLAAGLAGFATAFILRAAAILLRLELPGFPGRGGADSP